MKTAPSSRATTACPGMPRYGSSAAARPSGSRTMKRNAAGAPALSGVLAASHVIVAPSGRTAGPAAAAPR